MIRDKRNALIFFVALILLFLSYSVLEFSNSRTKPNEKSKRIVIGFSIHGQEVERWKKERILAENYSKKNNFTILIKDANNNPYKQIEQCENLLLQGIDVLIVVPEHQELAGEIVKIAKEYKVPVIAYDRLIKNVDLDYYVSFDSLKVGELQAKELVRRVPSGNYVILKGSPVDNNVIYITQGNKNILEPMVQKEEITIVAEDYCINWSGKEAYKHTIRALNKFENISGIIAQNDQLAKFAINALERKDLAGKVLVSGQDADLSTIKQIMKNNQTMTVYKPIKQLNKSVFDLALKIANGEKVELNGVINNGYSDIPTMLLDVISVTKDNIKDTVIKDGFYTKEQIYKK